MRGAQVVRADHGEFIPRMVRFMNRSYRSLLALLLVLPVVEGRSASSPVDGSGPAAAGSPIHLDYRKSRLVDVASELKRRGGIAIVVPRDLAADRISREVRAGTWTDAVREVFADYDYAAVTGPDGRLLRLFLQARISRATAPTAKGGDSKPGISRRRLVDRAISDASALPGRFRGLNPDSVAPVEIPFARLAKLKRGESVTLTLGGEATRLFHDRRWTHEDGDTSWVGQFEQSSGLYRAVLTYGPDGGAVGFINTPAGEYRIEQADGKTWAITMRVSGLHPGTLTEDQQLMRAPVPTRVGSDWVAATAAMPATVDLMVLYAPDVNDNRPLTRVHHLVDLARQSFADSAVFVRLNLAHTAAIEDDGQKSNIERLRDLTSNRMSQDIAALRQRYGADLVLLVRSFRSSPQRDCGVAWVAGSNQQPLSREMGFAVVSDGHDGGYYCHDYTFAHELGHLFGNVHDQALSDPGVFPFSYAWGIPGEFATIMSYLIGQAPLVGRFANPALVCTLQGLRCGDPDIADNARTINLTANRVADFSESAAP